MKSKWFRQTVLLFATVLICFFTAGNAYAAGSTNNAKYYRIKNLRLSCDSTTGQVKAVWSDARKTTDKVVLLYQDGILVYTQTVSGTSCDFTQTVKEEGLGVYMVEVYPTKLGEDYKLQSSDLEITASKLEKVKQFYADDYTFDNARLVFDESRSTFYGTWIQGDKKSAGRVQLLKGSTVVGDSWYSATGDTCDFTTLAAQKGSGTYTIKVYPSRLGDTYVITSEEFNLTAAMHKTLKAAVAEEEKRVESQRIGWVRNGPTGGWYYYKQPGVKAKKEWQAVNGVTYHFSSAGIMQVGWQVIDAAYYYFDTNGALLTNTVTPDGCRVNEKGQYVDDKGAVVSAKGEEEAPALPVTLSSCTISVSESSKEGAGVVKTVTFREGTGFEVEDVTFSTESSQWKAGVPVTVRLTVTADTNYSFSSSVKFTARNCKNVTSAGDTKRRTVTFSYYPKMQLKAPDIVYITESDTLCWKKVTDASRYKVVVTEDGTTKISSIVEVNKLDLSGDVSINEDTTINVKIYSMGSKANSGYLLTSQAAAIDNLYVFAQTNQINGELKWSGSTLRYIDENGQAVTGWKQLLGSWYYFKNTGHAAGPGWFKDENNLWYYFDENHRMCTGNMTIEGKAYFLNDGSVTNLPLGAWVKK